MEDRNQEALFYSRNKLTGNNLALKCELCLFAKSLFQRVISSQGKEWSLSHFNWEKDKMEGENKDETEMVK